MLLSESVFAKNRYINRDLIKIEINPNLDPYDLIEIPVSLLHNNCSFKVEVKCDYCGQIFEKEYKKYILGHKDIDKDCCYVCIPKKQAELNLQKYNVKNAMQREEVKQKVALDYSSVKEQFKKKGYKLLSKKYENNKQELEYICKKHKNKGIQKTTLGYMQKNTCNCVLCIKEQRYA